MFIQKSIPLVSPIFAKHLPLLHSKPRILKLQRNATPSLQSPRKHLPHKPALVAWQSPKQHLPMEIHLVYQPPATIAIFLTSMDAQSPHFGIATYTYYWALIQRSLSPNQPLLAHLTRTAPSACPISKAAAEHDPSGGKVKLVEAVPTRYWHPSFLPL